MIKSYWLRLLLFAAAGAALGLGISLASPKRYEGFVQILVDQSFGPSLPPSNESMVPIMDIMNAGRSRSVATHVEQLTSWGVITKAAENSARRMGASSDDPDFNPENIQQSLSVFAEATSDLITLRIRSSSQEKAKVIAGEIFAAYADLQTENSRRLGQQALAVLENQAKQIKSELEVQDEKMRELRQRGAGPDIITMVTRRIEGTERLREGVDGMEVELAGVREQMAGLKRQIAALPPEVVASSTESANPNILALDGRISEARAQLDLLLERRLPDSDVVLEQQKAIRSLERERDQMRRAYSSSKVEIQNPIRESLRQQLENLKAAETNYVRRISAGRAEIAKKEDQQRNIPPIQDELQKLLREQVVLERKYTDINGSIASLKAVGTARTSPVQLVGAPAALPEPVSPKHPVNMMFGLVAGLILGVLSMLSTEGRRQPIRSLAQLNALAASPVYRIIPELRMPFRGLNKAPAEPYETLLVNFRRSEKRPYRIGVVGIAKDSGASITALNVALAAEKHGFRSTIVETDERSTIRRLLARQGVPTEEQLTHVSPYVSLYSVDALRQVAKPDGSSGFEADVERLENDLTVFDFEPATESAEYAFAASNLDEMIVLVRADRTKSVEFLHAQQALAESGCPLVTVVFARSTDIQLVGDAAQSFDRPKALTT
jgi:uncharacterized protein involved in exopolysaccharide biosynthesis